MALNSYKAVSYTHLDVYKRQRIIDAVAKRLHADRDKFPTNLERVGNMSSASIPVLLDELNRQRKLHRGDRIVLAGFGAGLTIGACVMTW